MEDKHPVTQRLGWGVEGREQLLTLHSCCSSADALSVFSLYVVKYLNHPYSSYSVPMCRWHISGEAFLLHACPLFMSCFKHYASCKSSLMVPPIGCDSSLLWSPIAHSLSLIIITTYRWVLWLFVHVLALLFGYKLRGRCCILFLSVFSQSPSSVWRIQ